MRRKRTRPKKNPTKPPAPGAAEPEVAPEGQPTGSGVPGEERPTEAGAFARWRASDPLSSTEEDDYAEAPAGAEGAEETVPLEQHQRLLAEFDNYRKRMERALAQREQLGVARLLRALLPLLDDIRRGRAAMGDHPEAFDRNGALIILDRLAETLQREGLAPIEASPGTEFDPEVHEAVLTIPSGEIPAGAVAEVLEAGYSCDGRMLRPARVAVSRGADEESTTADTGKG